MKIIVVAITSVASAVLATASAPAASAATPSWLHVHTATRATAYNNSMVRITPSATASGQRVITKQSITVYRKGKRYRSGLSVKLPAGRYSTVTSGAYKTYSLVTEQRTHQVLHASDYASATCTVTQSDDAGLGDGTTHSTATCRNGYWPTQAFTDEEYDYYQLGDTYSENEFFDDEYVSQNYSVTVRHFSATHSFGSAKRRLTVVNGGFRRLLYGSGIETTASFRAPGSTWKVSYSWDCSDFGYAGNMIITVYRSNGDYFDLAANRIGYTGSSHSYEHGGGRFYLEMNSECDWRVVVTK